MQYIYIYSELYFHGLIKKIKKLDIMSRNLERALLNERVIYL